MPIKSRIMNNRNRNKSSRVRNNYRRINLKSSASKRLRTKNNNRRSKHRQFGGRGGAEKLMEITNIDATVLTNYLKNELGANAKHIKKGKCTGIKRKFEANGLKVYKIKVPTGRICVTAGTGYSIPQIKGNLEKWVKTEKKPELENDISNRFDAKGAHTVQTLAASNNKKRVANTRPTLNGVRNIMAKGMKEKRKSNFEKWTNRNHEKEIEQAENQAVYQE